jgi:Ca2+-binding EF-hand superfamily protein
MEVKMDKRTSLLIALFSGASLFCAQAWAQHHEGRIESMFKKADKDNDGTLDKEEAKAMPRVSKNFDAIDTDKDGTVSLDEVKGAMKGRHGKGMGMHEKGKAAFE